MSQLDHKSPIDPDFNEGDVSCAAGYYLEDTCEPLFTRVRMEEAAKQLRMIAPDGGSYELHDIHNVKQQLHVKLANMVRVDRYGKSSLGIRCRCWLRVPDKLRAQALSTKSRPTHPLCITTYTYGRHDCSKETEEFAGNFEEELRKVEAEWETSCYRKELKTFLQQNVEYVEKIDRICCFGLGPLVHSWKDPHSYARSYTQHLAACTVRDVLSQYKKNNASLEQIKIYAQDPIYCETCETTLRTRLNIEVVDDPDGFLLIDENTFVISIAPNVPVSQVAVDMTADSGGPAGMFCCSLTSECDDTMAKKFLLCTDPHSPRVLDYVNECVELDFDEKCIDGEDHPLGNTSVYLRTKMEALK